MYLQLVCINPCIVSWVVTDQSSNSPYNDPKSFAALSMALESVGQSAYMGAARLIDNPDTLTEAAVSLSSVLKDGATHGHRTVYPGNREPSYGVDQLCRAQGLRMGRCI